MPQKIIIKKMPQNPYLLAFFKVHNLSVGDTYVPADYIIWIDGKHEDFRKINKLPSHIELNEKECEKFIQYILNG